MNSKFSTKLIALIVTACFFVSGMLPVFAESPDEIYTPDFSIHPPVSGEAAKSVVDRVFGVQGEAASIEYHVYELSNRTPTSSAIRSAVVPGWGQFFNDQPTKGVLFFTVFTAALAGSIIQYRASRDSFTDYRTTGIKNSSTFDDYEDEKQQSWILAGVAVAMWGVAVWDAHSNAYTSLYSTEAPLQLAVNHGAESEAILKWRRKF
jgi:hypothetical protein